MFLSNIRDFMVKLFGLKATMIPEQRTLDKSIRYNLGDKAIYFVVINRSDTEIVMAKDDKHLYFRTSLLIEENPDDSKYQYLFLTTIVEFHNIWGRIYFAFVRPFHKLLMKKLLSDFLKTI